MALKMVTFDNGGVSLLKTGTGPLSMTSPTYRSQGDTFQELLAPTVGVEVTDASREGQSKKNLNR